MSSWISSLFGGKPKNQPLIFKNSDACLDYAMRFMTCKVAKGHALAAVVTGIGEYDGGPDRGPDDGHVVRLKIPTDHGLREVIGMTERPHSRVEIGELVEWVCTTIKEPLVAGIIISRLEPAIETSGWVVKESLRA